MQFNAAENLTNYVKISLCKDVTHGVFTANCAEIMLEFSKHIIYELRRNYAGVQ